jgi:hypothetical protein
MILASHGIIASSGGINPLTVGLVSSYSAENNVNDSFGSNNGTAIGGLTYTTGKSGNAFQFNGTNSYVSIPNTTDHLNFTGDFSISLWVNYNTTSASIEAFFANLKPGGTFGSGYVLYTDATQMYFDMRSQSVNNSLSIPFVASINTWYHVVATRKRNTESKVYINGTLQSGVYPYLNPTVNQTYQTNQEYRVGSFSSASPLLSNIKIDEIGIWNRVLTSTEVTELQTKYYPF